MAKRVQFIGNTTAGTATFAGLIRELTIDTDLYEIALHTGAGAGTNKRIPNKDTNDTLYQAKTTLLTNIAALATADGMIAKTGAATVALRTLTGTANQITVTNGGGAGGNPTIALSPTVQITGLTTMQAGAVVSGGGIAQTGGNNSFVTTQITGLTATLAGALTGAGNNITNAVYKQSHDTTYVYGNMTGNSVIDLSNGNFITATLTGAATVSFTGMSSTQTTSYAIQLTNGGAFSVRWPTGTKWPGGSAPALTSSGVDIIAGYTPDNGTTFRQAVVQSASA